MAISNLVTSPHAVCYINGIPLAKCSGLSYDVMTPRREIRGIDVLEPVEIVPMSAMVRGSMQIYRLHQDGAAEAAGLVGTFKTLTREKYFALTVIDRFTDTVLINVSKCSVSNQSWSISPRTFVLGSVSWTGFSYENEAE